MGGKIKLYGQIYAQSANRFTAISGQQSAAYGYNGLGDRLTQNGVNYTLDLNSGLTQVLADGTNTYLYGADRIAQVNTTTEYFLTDALGSVRQLTDAGGAVTYIGAYDPYGTLAQSAGSAQTSYGFTGEFTDPGGMVYLRARYYMPGDGRFLTRDTWMGDTNNPLSLNRWNYTQSNPVNYTDPTGQRAWCTWWWNQWAVKQRVDVAEEYVTQTSDPMDTYTAAGIAIQCAGTNWNTDSNNSGSGLAQISLNEAKTKWGEPIYNLNWRGDKIPIMDPATGKQAIDRNGNLQWEIRSYGLACPDGKPEKALDPNNTQDAVILMKRRIQLVTNECTGYTSTDKYIAAALAQNGSGFTYKDMQFLGELSSAVQSKYLIKTNWFDRFKSDMEKNNGVNTRTQLNRFTLVIKELQGRGWYVPDDQIDFSWDTIEILRNWKLNQVNP